MTKNKNLYQPVKRLRKDVVLRKDESKMEHENASGYVLPEYVGNNSFDVMLNFKKKTIPNKFVYISDYFMSEFRTWYYDSYVFINSGTGTGKTTFIEKLAKLGRYGVLVLTNRKANRKQIENHLKNCGCYGLIGNVNVISYQTLEKNKDLTSDILDLYDFIVCDESHYFLADSDFNSQTNLSLMKVMGTKRSIKIFMSATNQDIQVRIIERLKRRYNNDLIVAQKVYIYEMQNQSTKIRNIISFESFERDLLKEVIESKDKWLIFVKSIPQGKDIYRQLSKSLGEGVVFLDKESADEGTDIQRKTFKLLIEDETFYQKVLITTSLLDNGVNIRSFDLKNIVCFDDDPIEIVQMIGRKRFINGQNDYFDLFLINESNQSLAVSLGNSISKKKKFISVKKDIEEYQELDSVHYLNTKEGEAYRNMSYFNPYIPHFFKYSYNYLGYSKVCTEIKNLNQLRKADNPFDVKVRWILEKVSGSIEGEILSSSRLNAERFLLSIQDLLNKEFPYETKKDKIYFHSLMSKHFWTWFKKENGERNDRPLSVEKLKEKFIMLDIGLDFVIENGKIKLIKI
ncbi:helicase-related protein [Clostridium sp. AUH-JLR23]|uniref:helicase-related protein n=1 Tax=Clostridium sp. AUH-JLR23 TaxID=1505062 RepID=UPI003567CAB8